MWQCCMQNAWLHPGLGYTDLTEKLQAGLGPWHSTSTSWRLVCPLMPATALSCYTTGWTESPEYLKTSIPLLPHIKHYGLFFFLLPLHLVHLPSLFSLSKISCCLLGGERLLCSVLLPLPVRLPLLYPANCEEPSHTRSLPQDTRALQ